MPAKCTDLHQECDTVANKPFKVGVKEGFQELCHQRLQQHFDTQGAFAGFSMKLTVGAMKPHMYEFVKKGLTRLNTPAMKTSIRHAFAEHGRFSKARTAAAEIREATAIEDLATVHCAALIHVPEGREIENFDVDDEADAGEEVPK